MSFSPPQAPLEKYSFLHTVLTFENLIPCVFFGDIPKISKTNGVNANSVNENGSQTNGVNSHHSRY